MEGSGWRPAQGDPGMASGDWRSELSTESRQRIVNKIMDTLKKHLPISGPEGLSELNKIAVRFEEKIYAAAISQPDYLRKLSLKILTMESKSSNANPLATNSAAGIQNSQDPAPQFQSQRVLPEASSAPMETTPLAMHATTIDWQEEVYQKIKALKDLYFDELNDLYQKFILKCQQQEALGQTQMRSDLIDKLRNYRNVLKTILTYLTIPKNGISPGLKDKIGPFERQILCILLTARKPTQNQQGQQQQAQQSQTQPLQQQMMPQIQNQPTQLQQQIPLQQQPNNLQRELQNGVQTSGGLLQQPGVVDQQKPQFQSQRVFPEASSAPMETTPLAMHATTIDWQEEAYQKIKALKDLYFDELNDLYQKLTLKCQQQEALGQIQMQSDQIDKLRNYRNVLKTTLTCLTIPKNGISLGFKDKIGSFERQILYILNMFKARKPTQNQQGQQQQLPPPSGGQSLSVQQQQQQQLPPPSGGQSLSLQQQQQQHQPQPQISQLQHNESHASQLQSVNLQNSLNSMQSRTMTTMQDGSMPLGQNAGIPTSQQNMRNVLQSGSHMDSTQANNLVAVQQRKNLKRSCSHVMGKEKKCRMSCAVEEENLCAICLDPVMDNGDRSTAKLRCSHQFHLDCIGSAFNAKASMQCPTCRRVENGQWRFCR